MKKSIWLTFLSICFIGAFSSATAQEIGLQAIGGGLGMSDYQGGVGSAVMFEGAAALGTVAENLNLDARVGFWSKSEGSVSFRDFIIGAAVSYALGSGDSKIQPYAGGGLSLHFSKPMSMWTWVVSLARKAHLQPAQILASICVAAPNTV